jgi:hypothetical protein
MHVKKQKENVLMVDKIIVDKDFAGNVWEKLILIQRQIRTFDIVKEIAIMLH